MYITSTHSISTACASIQQEKWHLNIRIRLKIRCAAIRGRDANVTYLAELIIIFESSDGNNYYINIFIQLIKLLASHVLIIFFESALLPCIKT